MRLLAPASLALLALGGLVAAGCSDSNAPSHPVVDLISCPPSFAGGDNLSRALYVSSYPGTTLSSATSYFDVTGSGDRTVALTARLATFDGTVLGSDTVTFSAVDGDTAHAVTFNLGGATVTTGSTVTFEYTPIADTGGALFQVTSSSNVACPVVETGGVTPPLDTLRRNGMAFKIRGKE